MTQNPNTKGNMSNIFQREPVIAAVITADVPLVISFLNELGAKHTDPLTAVLVGGGTVLLNALAAFVRSKVTPTG